MKSFLLRPPAEPFRVADEPVDAGVPPEQRALSFRPLPPELDIPRSESAPRVTAAVTHPAAAAPALSAHMHAPEDPAALAFTVVGPPGRPASPQMRAHDGSGPRPTPRLALALVATLAVLALVTDACRQTPTVPSEPRTRPAPPQPPAATARPPRRRPSSRPSSRGRGDRHADRPSPNRRTRRRADHTRRPAPSRAATTTTPSAPPRPAVPARTTRVAPPATTPRNRRPAATSEFGFERG